MADMSLRKSYVMLLNELNLDLVLPVMFSEGLIPWSDYQSLVAQKNVSSERHRRDTVLLDLPRNGPTFYLKFCECLVWSGQSTLAEKMEFDVSNVSDPNKHNAYSTGGIPSIQPLPSFSNPTHNQPVQPVPPPSNPIPRHLDLPMAERLDPVLVLYCKDNILQDSPELRPTERRNEIEYCQEVSDFVETLTLFSNNLFTCRYDRTAADGTFISNFLQWSETQMNECSTIILLCSPQLANPEKPLIEMEKGQFSRHSFINTIPHKAVIPVFLNMSKQIHWIPHSLRSAACYQVNVKALQQGCLGVRDARELVARATHCFESDERLKDLVELLKILRKETPPVICMPPIDLPTPPEPKLEEIVPKIFLIWQELGTRLGVSFFAIQQIRQRSADDNVGAARQMLEAWKREKGKDATKQALINALNRCKYPAIAREVENNFKDEDF